MKKEYETADRFANGESRAKKLYKEMLKRKRLITQIDKALNNKKASK